MTLLIVFRDKILEESIPVNQILEYVAKDVILDINFLKKNKLETIFNVLCEEFLEQISLIRYSINNIFPIPKILSVPF